MQIVVLYILLCMLAGVIGKNCRIGFWGVSILAFFITPPIAMVFTMLFGTQIKLESGQ
ncbi:hypothetical protein ACXX82_00050 [Glaciimonas sp. GNP009]